MAEKKCYNYVRFSSAAQAAGDSLRRQTEGAEKWAKEHGYTIDDTLQLDDKGVSAFKGKNASEGALSRFMEAIQKGKVPTGSVLIVESLDRLSRENPSSAQYLFLQIIVAGIEIVSLLDGQRYTKDMKLGQIITSSAAFSTANEESSKKSNRVGAAWSEKRKEAITNKVAMTARLPKWLELDEQRKIVAIPDRAKLVKRIFKMTIAGYGTGSIASKFTEEGIEPWGQPRKKNAVRKTPIWHTSYIRKIQKNESVTGKFTPSHDLGGGERVGVEEIPDYFPRIISDSEFQEAQLKMSSKKTAGGKTGKVSNLFTHRVKCAYCGGPVVFANHGGNSQHLVCDNARRGKCTEKYTSIRYKAFESAVLEYCSEINLQDILAPDNTTELIEATRILAETTAQINHKKNTVQFLLEAITSAEEIASVSVLTKRMDATSREIAELDRQIEVYKRDVSRLSSSSQYMRQRIEDINRLRKLSKIEDESVNIEIRKKLKRCIGDAIKQITVYPDGLHTSIIAFDGRSLSVKPFIDGGRVDGLAEHLEANTGRSAAMFFIEFSNGYVRIFQWSDKSKEFSVNSEITPTTMVVGGYDFTTGLNFPI